MIVNKLNGGGGGSYTLPIASETELGGIKVGNNLSIDENGSLSAEAEPYELPVATDETLGGVKVGDNLTIDENGVLSGLENLRVVNHISDITYPENAGYNAFIVRGHLTGEGEKDYPAGTVISGTVGKAISTELSGYSESNPYVISFDIEHTMMGHISHNELRIWPSASDRRVCFTKIVDEFSQETSHMVDSTLFTKQVSGVYVSMKTVYLGVDIYNLLISFTYNSTQYQALTLDTDMKDIYMEDTPSALYVKKNVSGSWTDDSLSLNGNLDVKGNITKNGSDLPYISAPSDTGQTGYVLTQQSDGNPLWRSIKLPADGYQIVNNLSEVTGRKKGSLAMIPGYNAGIGDNSISNPVSYGIGRDVYIGGYYNYKLYPYNGASESDVSTYGIDVRGNYETLSSIIINSGSTTVATYSGTDVTSGITKLGTITSSRYPISFDFYMWYKEVEEMPGLYRKNYYIGFECSGNMGFTPVHIMENVTKDFYTEAAPNTLYEYSEANQWEVRNIKALGIASDTQLGGVKVGSGLTIDENGVLSADGGGGGSTVTWTPVLASGTTIATIDIDGTSQNVYAPEITVDSEMSDSSTNPVQNNVVKDYIDTMVGDIETLLASI